MPEYKAIPTTVVDPESLERRGRPGFRGLFWKILDNLGDFLKYLAKIGVGTLWICHWPELYSLDSTHRLRVYPVFQLYAYIVGSDIKLK